YGSGEGAGKEFRKMKDVFEDTDLVLLVMNVTSPARDADRQFLEHMSEWFLAHPELKPPPVLGVLTHIDLLTPQMEWDPPYNWESPTGAKEEKIQQALAFNIETLGDFLVGILPVCTNV